MPRFPALILALAIGIVSARANGVDRLVFEPPTRLANGKHIVLVSGDEEYRSEESCPMLAKILSQRHGFRCTVLFAIDPESGIINPNVTSNIPGLDTLYEADLMILGTRWRTLPGDQLQPILDFLNAAKPLIAFRTATHAFNNDDRYGGYDWQNFGLQVVGENWLSHHGEHKVQGGRGVVVPENAAHPILNSVPDIFTWSDIYGIENLDQEAATVLLRGAVTESLDPLSPAVDGPQNDPMMPLAWIKTYPTPDSSDSGICFATTAGAAVDLQKADLRRLFVNAAYHLLDLSVPEMADVTPVDPFHPSFYGFESDQHWVDKSLRPSDFALGSAPPPQSSAQAPKATQDLPTRIVLLGNGLPERMLHYGFFESELYRRFPDQDLIVRTLAFPGFTPGFRPHPSRSSQWAFPGAADFHPEYAHHSGQGRYPTDDEWLAALKPDLIVAFYGFNESFDGPKGLERFRAELTAFVDHTLSKSYGREKSDHPIDDGKTHSPRPPRLVLVTPIAFQDLSGIEDLPNGKIENRNLARYARVVEEVATAKGLPNIDLFTPTADWFASSPQRLTVNGAHLNADGYRRLAPLLADSISAALGIKPSPEANRLANPDSETLRKAVLDKNWYWRQDYQMPNGVHAYGRRFEPFGDDNYPEEIEKVRQLTANRDRAIWALLKNESYDLAAADAKTRPLTPIPTNAPERAANAYRYGQDALDSFTLPSDFQINLFTSESEFPNLANPVQLSFDNHGRLWVAVMPSYPHYRPGDPRPNDKLLIYEDSDGDGAADKEIVFADNLHLPIGFELAPEGVYLSQAPDLVLLSDTDGDDRADRRKILLSGFDTHDTHHAISAFTADPSGAVLMSEGVFLHSNVETAHGPIRGVNGGFYRFDPRTHRLRRLAQTTVPNPWGIAIDDWGQEFYLDTSNPALRWMLPIQLQPRYGELAVASEDLVEPAHRVRPTAGLEFISSRHFPEGMQGDLVLGNSIGFLGLKQHALSNSETGYTSTFRQNLLVSSDPNFRPVDLEIAPDGSLYLVDWHNQLIGHMQHSARDPLRDHAHGRIYRITHKHRPLLNPPAIANAPISDLLEILKLPEARSRYRARRELRRFPASETIPAVHNWIQDLNTFDSNYERLLLEALWVTWGANAIDKPLLSRLLKADLPEVRSAAVRALRYHAASFPNALDLLKSAAADPHGRVRLEAIVAATWLNHPDALQILNTAAQHPIDPWMDHAHRQASSTLGGARSTVSTPLPQPPEHLDDATKESWLLGAEVYRREAHCATCHMEDGSGLPAANFPPLANSEWVTGNPDRLVDLVLHGLIGEITVNGQRYPGHVPMTPFNALLSDEEVAAVATYVRNAFGHQASPVSESQAAAVRQSSAEKQGFWTVPQLQEKYGE